MTEECYFMILSDYPQPHLTTFYLLVPNPFREKLMLLVEAAQPQLS